MIEKLWNWVTWAWSWFATITWALIKENPYVAWMFVYAFARATAVTVDTGQTGLLFHFGRTREVVQPGFRWLIPFLQVVRIMPTRARTIDLPAQRVTTADGLVVDVDANLVYRVVDVRKALIQIDRLEKAMAQVLGLSVQLVLRTFERHQLRVSEDLNERLAEEMGPVLEPWGVAVERAGCSTIKPSPETLPLVQLSTLSAERAEQLTRLRAGGLPDGLALPLCGSAPRVERRAIRARERELQASRRRQLRTAIRKLGQEYGIHAARPLLALQQAGELLLAGREVEPREVSPRWKHKHQDVGFLAGRQAGSVASTVPVSGPPKPGSRERIVRREVDREKGRRKGKPANQFKPGWGAKVAVNTGKDGKDRRRHPTDV